jgi:hypothetical protein
VRLPWLMGYCVDDSQVTAGEGVLR